MHSIRSYSLVLLFSSFFAMSSFVHAADINAGQNKAALCISCHGAGGNSKSPQYPVLAGQKSMYLENQLNAFQSGQRTNSVMQGMAATLTTQDIQNISAYFASLTSESAGGDPSLAKKGEPKTAVCKGCHGTNAQGRGGFPKLAGQQPAYIEKQLLNFKNHSRKGGPMNAMASNLSEQDIKEIAAYLGSL